MNLFADLDTRPFPVWMQTIQADMEAALDRHLPRDALGASRLHDAMRYVSLGGGKRIRPLLVFAAGELVSAHSRALEVLACAIECIHVYSLVHDDLPCMDDDTLRRGRPTCHIQFDEASALLVGDSLQSLAFELLTHPVFEDPVRQVSMVRLLAQASGSCGMAGGQAIDLAAVGHALDLPSLELMHRLKTGALIRAAVLLGVLAGGRGLSDEAMRALDDFTKHLGLLFQVVDDVLDCTMSTASLGKTAGKDASAHKPTYVSLLGLDAAKAFAKTLEQEALGALAVFGDHASRLRDLTRFVAHRDS